MQVFLEEKFNLDCLCELAFFFFFSHMKTNPIPRLVLKSVVAFVSVIITKIHC